ncbi:thioredoxin family protein [Candidatus Dojkabacteria bacterium]|uniref:Thioredoxin family protein n=1 Tax=Candidatus Dojkabacteria bacterium TaxID=2099670 RepID=A0A955LAP8_9BACT|nr:thioredoxin family protein [Candidatus Dojkabacteria bacterium]
MENQMNDSMPGENAKMLKPKPKMNTKLIAVVVVVIVIAVLAILVLGNRGSNNSESNTEQPGGVESMDLMQERLDAVSYDKVAVLKDVNSGEVVGMAYYFFDEEAGFYNLNAEFSGLPEVNLDKEFYEGWIVNSSTQESKSTDELTIADGNYVNTFRSKRNYSSYDKYILTIEPRDGDPAPALHVAEGVFMTELPKDTQEDINNQDTTEGTQSNESGIYVDYSEELLTNANSGDVVLFFKADWCPTCSALDKNILENMDSIPSELSILKVDYDNSEVLQEKYGVTYQHTLVQVDSTGELLNKWTGSFSIDEIVQNLV